MVEAVAVLDREIGVVAPAVRLAREKGDAFRVGRLADERGEIPGQRGERQLVDDAMAFVIPGLERPEA